MADLYEGRDLQVRTGGLPFVVLPEHLRVNVLAQPGQGALGDAARPHRRQFIDPAGGHSTDPRPLDHYDQRLLGRVARLQEAEEIAAMSVLSRRVA